MLNFMISILGWFLWNWAEFSIAKQEGDGGEYTERILRVLSETPTLTVEQKSFLTIGIKGVLRSPINLRAYARTHWETWVGSVACIALLLWVGYRQVSLDPFEVVVGTKLSWSDLYLLGSGFAWDAIIFAFKKGRNFFKKKEQEL